MNLSSIAGLAGWGPIHYAAAKGAVLAFTRAASRELGAMGIRINAIAPGVIETPMTAGVDEALLAPMASDESSFPTGQWISPNGGLITI